MIKHIVLWKINEGGTEEDRKQTLKQFREKTEYLKTIIPEIKKPGLRSAITEEMPSISALIPYLKVTKRFKPISITPNI